MNVVVTEATAADLQPIADILGANRADDSLFQQPMSRLRSNLEHFLVARVGGTTVGCMQVRPQPRGFVELLAVAVHPGAHGRGVGTALVRAGVERARALRAETVWLGTAKPIWFARHGFVPMSRWRLPLRVLVPKLRRVFEQPIARWLPAIFGHHVFMSLPSSARRAAPP